MPSAPIACGDRNSAASSTRSARRKAAARIGPVSTISRVMPRSANSLSTAARSSRPSSAARATPRRPRAASACSRSCGAASPVTTHSGVCRALATSLLATGSRSCCRARCAPANVAMPGSRQVSSGSSASTVPMPVITASLIARMQMDARARRLAGDRRGRRPASPALPSAETASLSITCGRPSCTRRIWPACARRASSAPMPDLDRDAALAPCASAPRLRPPDWDRPARRPRAPCRRRSWRRRRAASCRNASTARASCRAWRRARRARTRERLGLGMRTAAGLRPAAPDDDAVLHDTRTDRRIGPGAPEPAPPERERQPIKRASSALRLVRARSTPVQFHRYRRRPAALGYTTCVKPSRGRGQC